MATGNPYFDTATAVVAVAGFGLSVYNAIRQSNRERVKLRVTLAGGFIQEGGGLVSGNFVTISVVNLSEFSVFISEVGLRNPGEEGRLIWLGNLSPMGQLTLPYELGARRSIKFYSQTKDFSRYTSDYARAFVSTECGVTVEVKGPILAGPRGRRKSLPKG